MKNETMPFIKVYIHFVWSTKNRISFLDSKELRHKFFVHIRDNAKGKGIYIDHINGFVDHVHCLISLGTDQTIQKIMQLIKGESSFWINHQQVLIDKFEWQEEYFAVSVSESQLNKVRNYILNQETHHQKKTFQDEYDELIVRHGFQRYEDK
ncbi:MAG: IS200/IS605 family transposase [Prolixibacteraceae bacterium]|nr:IS200/IS605 family transposase [Prolixibacteraceae bacterium]